MLRWHSRMVRYVYGDLIMQVFEAESNEERDKRTALDPDHKGC